MGRQRPLWAPSEQCLGREAAEGCSAHASRHWENFYKHNADKFFKDRHYLDQEFPELASNPCNVLELNLGLYVAWTLLIDTQAPVPYLQVGCGVGNTAFPLLVANPQLCVYACDLSATAIDIVRAHPLHSTGRVTAFVADIAAADLTLHVPAASIDLCTMVFVLSAISPDQMGQAIACVAATLKPGTARVLVRDYAEGDLAQQRFQRSGRMQRISHNFYARSDGTCAYFFSQTDLRGLFAHHGFTCQQMHVQQRQIENRQQGIVMHRRWIQAVFTYQGPACPATQEASQTEQQAGSADVAGPEHHNLAATVLRQAEVPAVQDGLPPPGPAGAGCIHQEAAREAFSQAERAGLQGTVPLQQLQRNGGRASSQADDTTMDDAVPQLEWEELCAGEEGLAALLQLEEPDLVEETVAFGKQRVRLRSVPRHHRNTLLHTGLMLWDSGPVLARLLLACPALTAEQHVLEVGCGVNPLCCLAALQSARRVVCTDGSPETLERLAHNLSMNACNVVIERARLRQLTWGDAHHLPAIQQEFSAGFDTILGSDVVYSADCVPDLFATAVALLAESRSARLMLCHVTRCVSEDRILAAAQHAGLKPLSNPACLTQEHMKSAGLKELYRLLTFALNDLPD